MPKTVLILGASGRVGRHAADAFWTAGWRVRLFDRETDDLMVSAKGADVIVNGWNPAYPDWAAEVPDLTARVIAAAEANGATIILPGNVYVFGKMTPSPWSEGSRHAATNTLGQIRVEMEAAYRASSAQVLILRAGDFLDTEASGNWFDAVIAKSADKGALVAPGNPDALHAWAYLPDLAQAMVALANKRVDLERFEDIPFDGYTLSLNDMARIAGQATGREFRVKRMAWWPLVIAVPFWKMARHLIEMRYLWSLPHSLDGSKMEEILPEFRPTDPATALASALEFKVQPDNTVTTGGFHVPAE